MASPPSDQSRRGASVIENTVAILRCFSPDRQELGVTEIAPEVGLHKSTVSRILAALEREGIDHLADYADTGFHNWHTFVPNIKPGWDYIKQALY